MQTFLINNLFKFIVLMILFILAEQTLAIVQKQITAGAVSDCKGISQFKKIDSAATPNIIYEVSYPDKDTYRECLERAEALFM